MIWFCSHFQFQERVLFAPFWSWKCSNRPCSGFLALQGSLKCHGIAVKTTTMAVVQLPKSLEPESIDDNPTRRHTRSSLPALDLEKCVLCESKKKNEKLLKPRVTYPLSLPQRFWSALLKYEWGKRTRVLLEIDQLTDLHAKEVMYDASSYRKFTSPKSLDSVAIANKENANFKSPSDHSTTEPNDSYQTWPSNVLPQWSRRGSSMLIVLWVYKTTLCHMYGKLRRDEVQETAVRGYSLKSASSSHMIKRHFDMRLVFHRPNKCTESQYVFSSEVQPGPIIEGCLRLD